MFNMLNTDLNCSCSYLTSLVPEIHCLKMETQERFSSVLRLPPGHTAPPVLEEAPSSLPGCQVSRVRANIFVAV